MMKITYFHRNIKAGYSINKVTQTIISTIEDKEEYYVPCYRFWGLLRNLWFVYRRRNKEGINHVTGDIHYCIIALVGCKSVLTIHDAVALDYNNGSWLSKKIAEWLWFRIPLQLATKVVCISEETKKSIQRLTKRTDIVVIHNAVDPSFETVLKKFSEKPLKILIIGTNANKNIDRTIQALVGLNCEVTFIGNLSKSQKQLLSDFNIIYCNKTNLSDKEIVQEYINCDIVSFVSLYEGFGMPIVEANVVGRPVVASNIPVLREVAGDSAVFIDPYNVDSIRKGIVRLMENPKLWMDCAQRGLQNANRFSQSIIKLQWMNLYNELIDD